MLTVISVTKASDSGELCAPQVVISPGAVTVADAGTGGGGGGGGATPHVVISPARAARDSTKSNVTAAHSFRKCFIVFSKSRRMVCEEQREAVPGQALPGLILRMAS
jgi:hypothetical protein